MYKYPYLEQFYKDNYSRLLDWKSPLRPSKSCPKNGAAGVAKFQNFYLKTKSRTFTEDEVLTILNANNVEDGDTIFHQNLRVMRELNFVLPFDDGSKKYAFTDQFLSFVESNHTIDCYIIEKLMSIASVDDLTMYFNFLICVMREAALYGQVIQYRDSADKFALDVDDKQKRKEHQNRIYSVYGFKGDEARNVPEHYTPNISYFCHAVLKQLGILSKSEKKIDNMGTLVLTPLGELILKKIDDNLHYGQQNPIKHNRTIKSLNHLHLPLQQIFYGAPGTGKSYAAKKVVVEYSETVRTTFHPDSDYSTFVGAYKPTTTNEERYGLNGSNTIALVYPEGERKGKPIKDGKIAYKFVKQAFLKAYIKAWNFFKDSCADGQELSPQFLVIEEINRGNCAQIFGDLFQLLDRKEGFSEYPIEADEDIQNALLEEEPEDGLSFGKDGLNLTAEQITYINQQYDINGQPSQNVAEKIRLGQVLVLPPNFYIWATMNTSDQSLFPIDSAFKRRWDWKYVRICEGKKDGTVLNYRIKFNVPGEDPVDVKWWDFVNAINNQIEYATKSEDKKLGFFFCKPDKKDPESLEECNTIISAESFVGKVIFYLWQDVFKDYGFKSDIFKRENGKKLSFHDFYPENIIADKDTNPEGIDLALLKKFIQKVLDSNKDKEQPKTIAEA